MNNYNKTLFNFLYYIFLTLIIVFGLSTIIATGGGADSDTGEGNDLNNGGINTSEATAVIGPDGGIVEVTDTSSSLYGVIIDIPAGALDTDTNISINIQSAELILPAYFKKVSEVASISPDGLSFNIPVTISFPYDPNSITDKNMLSVYTFDEKTLTWNYLTLSDRSNNIIEALTQHFSSFIVAEYIKPLSSDMNDKDKFQPSINGFSIDSFKDYDNEGHCLGMAAFAAWYWKYKKADVNLYNKYSVCEQTFISDEAQNKIEYKTDLPENMTSDELSLYTKNVLIQEIDRGNTPILGMWKNDYQRHAVLVYRYKPNTDSSIEFYIYDPDYHGIDNIIETFENGVFKSDYYDMFTAVGWDSISKNSIFESIYQLESLPKVPELKLVSYPKKAPVDDITEVELFFRGCDIVTFHDVDIGPTGFEIDEYTDLTDVEEFQMAKGYFKWILAPTSDSERGTYTKRYSLIDANDNESEEITFKVLVP